jgi:Ca2+-binding EF-hand superfamily protein
MTRLPTLLGCVLLFWLPDGVLAEPSTPFLPGVVIDACQETVAVATDVSIGERPLTAFWDGYYSELFAILDRNDDGVLDPVESARVPLPTSILAGLRGDFDNVTADFAPVVDVDRSPADGRISRAELTTYLWRLGVGEIELRTAQTSQGLDLAAAQRLFELLAAPKGTLRNASFTDAYARLRRFDVDDDERLSFDELKLASGEQQSLATSGVQKLFRPLGEADDGEESALKLAIRLGVPQPSVKQLDPEPNPRVITQRLTEDSLAWQGRSLRLTFRVARGDGARDFDSARQSLLQQFEADDLDSNQLLDSNEVRRSAMMGCFSMLLAVADRNSDDRLTVAEMDRYLDLQASAARQCVVVTAADLGSSLALTLDANHDGFLSLRELRHGWSQVSGWDRSGDHELAWDEVPHDYQLTWSVGRPQAQVALSGSSTNDSSAPRWFQGMDRNGDGDLSRREFLGTLEEFRRWDTDGDSLVSPKEASRTAHQ